MNELLSIGVPFNNSTILPKRAIESRRKFRRVTHYRYLEKNETNVVIIFIYAFIKNIKNEIKGQKFKKTKQSNIYDSAASCFLNVLNRYFYFFRKPVNFFNFTFLSKLRTLHSVRVWLFVYCKHQPHEYLRKMPTYKQNLCCIMKMRQGIQKSCRNL